MAIIYKITNTKNNKIYVGKTTKTLQRRLTAHIKKAKKYVNRYLYDAMNKYGYDSFIINQIERVKGEKANEREKYWIKKLKSNKKQFGYNMTIGGDGGRTNYHYGVSPYEWWVKKHGKLKADELKQKTIDAARKSLLGKPGRKPTLKQRQEMSERMKKSGHRPPPLIPKYGPDHPGWKSIDIDVVKFYLIFGYSLSSISKLLNISYVTISLRFQEKEGISVYDFQKRLQYRNLSSDQIALRVKDLLDKGMLFDNISQIIGIKSYICRKCFRENYGLKVDEYRRVNHINYKDFDIEELNLLILKGYTLKGSAKHFGFSTDIIDNKLRKELNTNFSNHKKQLCNQLN